MKRILALVLVIAAVLSIAVLPASAQERRADEYIRSYSANITKTGGKLKINFSITATSYMTSLGVSFINLYCDGTLVETFYSDDYSSMLGSNKITHSGYVTYSDVQSGSEYYAYVRFYAKCSSGNSTANYYTANYTA